MKIHETQNGWTPKKIKNELDNAGLNQAAVARATEVTPSTVHDVIEGLTCSHKIHVFIGDAVGEKPEIIWPKYYKNGTPKRGRKMVVWQRKAT